VAKAKPKGEDDPAEDDTAGPARVDRDVAYASSSDELVVMDRQSGQVLWSRKARQVFRHNAVVAGAGKIFCIDAISPAKRDELKRRGEEPTTPPVAAGARRPQRQTRLGKLRRTWTPRGWATPPSTTCCWRGAARAGIAPRMKSAGP